MDIKTIRPLWRPGAALALLLLLAGCGTLFPKPVELFQKKVQPVPVKTSVTVEKERQAASYVAGKVEQAYVATLRDNLTNEALISPLVAARTVAPALSLSLGPPEKPWPEDRSAQLLADTLTRGLAQLNGKLDAYTERIDKLEGKKIEGTGLVQVPYLVYIFGLGVLVAVLWFILKLVALSNPAVALGMNVAKLGGKLAGRAFQEVVDGGEKFKEALVNGAQKTFTKAEVAELFRSSQERRQSPEVQRLVASLTN